MPKIEGLIRPVELLIGCREISLFLKLSQHKVREMEERGAPLFRDGNGTLRAEKAELWAWWRETGWKV